MLVLTRRKGQRIKIGPDVVVTIVNTKGAAIRVGVDAPQHMKILRDELEETPAPPTDPKRSLVDDHRRGDSTFTN